MEREREGEEGGIGEGGEQKLMINVLVNLVG